MTPEQERELRYQGIQYKVWREFYGALLAVPPDSATPLEVRVSRQARIISDMQSRIRGQRKEIKRHLKSDPIDPNAWWNGQQIYAYGRKWFKEAMRYKSMADAGSAESLSSDTSIAYADEKALIGLVMKLTGGSANPAVVKGQIENARQRVGADQ